MTFTCVVVWLASVHLASYPGADGGSLGMRLASTEVLNIISNISPMSGRYYSNETSMSQSVLAICGSSDHVSPSLAGRTLMRGRFPSPRHRLPRETVLHSQDIIRSKWRWDHMFVLSVTVYQYIPLHVLHSDGF